MGRDSHPRLRQAVRLARKQGRKAPGVRVLVVCEGKKTEPHYLDEIRVSMKLPTANVHVSHEGVTEPRQIVDAALSIFQNGEARPGKLPFEAMEADVVAAVFDRDEHHTYHDALLQMQRLDEKRLRNRDGNRVRFLAVPSNSCFELWLLLHERDLHAPIHRHHALREVKTRLQGYQKGWTKTFHLTRQKLPMALERAYQLAQRSNPFLEDGPYTAMHLLTHLLLDPQFPLPTTTVPIVGDPNRITFVKQRLGS